MDGAEFDGIDGLRTYLLTTRRDAFLRQFCRKLFASGGGEPVKARPAVVFSLLPLCHQPAFNQHSLQSGIERALLHHQHLFRHLLDMMGDAVAVHGADARQGLEDQHV